MVKGMVVMTLGIALLGMSNPSEMASQDVTGSWVARNSRNANGRPGTLTLEIRQVSDSVFGTWQWDGDPASSRAPEPLMGVVRSDSLLLVNSQRMPMLAVALKGKELVGRMAGGPFSRGVPDAKQLAQGGRPVRFERQ